LFAKFWVKKPLGGIESRPIRLNGIFPKYYFLLQVSLISLFDLYLRSLSGKNEEIKKLRCVHPECVVPENIHTHPKEG